MSDVQGELEVPKTPRTPAEEAVHQADKAKKKESQGASTFSNHVIGFFVLAR